MISLLIALFSCHIITRGCRCIQKYFFSVGVHFCRFCLNKKLAWKINLHGRCIQLPHKDRPPPSLNSHLSHGTPPERIGVEMISTCTYRGLRDPGDSFLVLFIGHMLMSFIIIHSQCFAFSYWP